MTCAMRWMRLWADVMSGKRRFKLYRQMKMYNDPALNPVLYRGRARSEEHRMIHCRIDLTSDGAEPYNPEAASHFETVLRLLPSRDEPESAMATKSAPPIAPYSTHTSTARPTRSRATCGACRGRLRARLHLTTRRARQTLAMYESALKLMQSGKFDKAHQAFTQMLADGAAGSCRPHPHVHCGLRGADREGVDEVREPVKSATTTRSRC